MKFPKSYTCKYKNNHGEMIIQDIKTFKYKKKFSFSIELTIETKEIKEIQGNKGGIPKIRMILKSNDIHVFEFENLQSRDQCSSDINSLIKNKSKTEIQKEKLLENPDIKKLYDELVVKNVIEEAEFLKKYIIVKIKKIKKKEEKNEKEKRLI
jgi:hypothetical protein